MLFVASGIAFSVFIVSAALSRFSASVVSKENAKKMVQKMLKKEQAERMRHHNRKRNVLDFVKGCYNAAKREVRAAPPYRASLCERIGGEQYAVI